VSADEPPKLAFPRTNAIACKSSAAAVTSRAQGYSSPNPRQDRVRFVLRGEGTEPQPIPNTPVVDALNPIEAGFFAACRALGRDADWRG